MSARVKELQKRLKTGIFGKFVVSLASGKYMELPAIPTTSFKNIDEKMNIFTKFQQGLQTLENFEFVQIFNNYHNEFCAKNAHILSC